MISRMRRAVVVICVLGCAPDPEGIRTEKAAEELTWCQVREVLADKCHRCHTDPPEHGAPFSLLTYEDTQVLDRRGTPRFERVYDAVESEYMPPTFLKLEPPVEPLTDAERKLLLDWAAANAEPTGGTSCDP
jgi:uncharacterized membrane protein